MNGVGHVSSPHSSGAGAGSGGEQSGSGSDQPSQSSKQSSTAAVVSTAPAGLLPSAATERLAAEVDRDEQEVQLEKGPDAQEGQGLPSQPAQTPAMPTAVERDMKPAAISAANRRHEERHGGV